MNGSRKADEKLILQVRLLSLRIIETLPYGIKIRLAMPPSKTPYFTHYPFTCSFDSF